jgi:hypothetical protein
MELSKLILLRKHSEFTLIRTGRHTPMSAGRTSNDFMDKVSVSRILSTSFEEICDIGAVTFRVSKRDTYTRIRTPGHVTIM